MFDQANWLRLMSALGVPDSITTFESLVQHYSEPHRFYHNGQHISAMLAHFLEVRNLASNPEELELAIWFHDAIYKPLSPNNEKESAEWVEAFLCSSGASKELTRRVYKLVMATLHTEELQTIDQQLIVDIDLSILGARPDVYDEFEESIRKEYRVVPSSIFKRKRKALLESFLRREQIFNTEWFSDKFEALARENLSRAVSLLR